MHIRRAAARLTVLRETSDTEKKEWKRLAEKLHKRAKLLAYINLCDRPMEDFPFPTCNDGLDPSLNLQGARPFLSLIQICEPTRPY